MPMWEDPNAHRAKTTDRIAVGWWETAAAHADLEYERGDIFDAMWEQGSAIIDSLAGEEAPAGDALQLDVDWARQNPEAARQAMEAEAAHVQAGPQTFAERWNDIKARRFATRQQRLEPLKARADLADQRGGSQVAAFVGSAAAALGDPVNLATMLLPGIGWANAASKAGLSAGRAALRVGASEAVVGAATEAVTAPVRATSAEALGEEFNPIEALAWGAAGGFAFGAALPLVVKGAKAGGRTAGKTAQAQLTKVGVLKGLGAEFDARVAAGSKPSPTQRAARTLLRKEEITEEALDGMSPLEAKAERQQWQIAEEKMAVGRAWDAIREKPQGKWDDLSVVLNADNINRAIVSRGGFKGKHGDLTVKGSGFGIVKIQVKHGPRGNKPEAAQIHRADLQALPDIIRSAPLPPRINDPPDLYREWVVPLPGPNGKSREVVVAVKQLSELDGEGGPQRLVTMHVLEDLTRDPRQVPRQPASPSEGLFPAGDTALGASMRHPSEGQAGASTNPKIGLDGAQVKPEGAGRGGVTVINPDLSRVDTAYEVVELQDVIPSHTIEGAANPKFPQVLQPRDRGARVAYQQQVITLAGNLEPQLLGRSSQADTGAPIIGPDGVVESGNGRAIALTEVYRSHPNKAQAYRDFLEAEGFSTAGMNQPVLVRRRVTPMTDAERAAFARVANKKFVSDLGDAERGLSDAADAGGVGWLTLYRGGDLTSKANQDFVQRFFASMPAAERTALIDKDGHLSNAGRLRINSAMLAAAYGESPALTRAIESEDNNIKTYAKTLLELAPQWGQLKHAIATGQVPARFDKTDELKDLARRMAHARDEGIHPLDLLRQIKMFGDDVPPFSAMLLRGLFGGTGHRRQLGQKRMYAILDSYTVAAQGQREANGVLLEAQDFPELSPEDLLEHAIGRGDILAPLANEAPHGLSADGATARARAERARVEALPKDTPTPQAAREQVDEALAAIDADPRLLAIDLIDEDGVGVKLADELEGLRTEQIEAKAIEGCSIDAPRGA